MHEASAASTLLGIPRPTVRELAMAVARLTAIA
jgi:hypothetical protein